MKENILLFFKCKISLAKAFDLEQHRQDFRDRGRTEPNHCTGSARGNRTRLMKDETAPPNYQQDNLQSVMHGAVNGLLHEIQANQLVSILQKRTPKQNENLCDWRPAGVRP
jgi:hypothetical protein